MKLRIPISAIAVGLFAGVTPSFAHHSTAMCNMVKPGDVIFCTGGAAKSGDPAMPASPIELPDGRTIRS